MADKYKYCVIAMPDRPSLQTMVTNIRAKVPAYVKHGGIFDADSQQQNLAGTKVKLFTMIDKEFPSLVQGAAGFAEYTQAEIMAVLATPEWTDPNWAP